MKYERHPISAAWPDMLKEDFDALKDSIYMSGLREAIVLFEGKILDGWHRYCACSESGVEAVFEEFTDGDPIQYVQDKHTRRPLTLTQRMTAIALMNQWAPVGRPGNNAPGALFTAPAMAKQAGASLRSAVQVKEAVAKGSTELVTAMREGKVSAKKAAAIAKLPKEEQAAAIEKPASKAAKIAPPPVVHSDELAESAHAIEALSEEVEVLKSQLAVQHMDGTGEEKSQAATLIADLRAEVKTLNAELDAMRISRDGLQRENRELIKQIGIYQRQLKQAQKA